MKIYVTFGQVHTHRINNITIDKDCVAILNASTHKKGRELAFEYFGDKFCVTQIEMPKMKYFPCGFTEIN